MHGRRRGAPELSVGDEVLLMLPLASYGADRYARWQVDEIFVVADSGQGDPPLYHLKDLMGNIIVGRYLNPVIFPFRTVALFRFYASQLTTV